MKCYVCGMDHVSREDGECPDCGFQMASMSGAETVEEYEEAVKEMAEEYRLDEMLPMMGLKIGKRCIILISRSVNAAEILDTLETLRCAEEKLMVVLEDACGRCDSVCEAQALPTDSAEKEVLQKIPDVLLYGLRGRGLCLRQLARHLVKGDTIYEK